VLVAVGRARSAGQRGGTRVGPSAHPGEPTTPHPARESGVGGGDDRRSLGCASRRQGRLAPSRKSRPVAGRQAAGVV